MIIQFRRELYCRTMGQECDRRGVFEAPLQLLRNIFIVYDGKQNMILPLTIDFDVFS